MTCHIWCRAISQRLECLAEVILVREITVDTGKPDIRNPVSSAQFVHCYLTNRSRTHFCPSLFPKIVLNLIDQFFNCTRQNWALGARRAERRRQLLSAKFLRSSITLQDGH